MYFHELQPRMKLKQAHFLEPFTFCEMTNTNTNTNTTTDQPVHITSKHSGVKNESLLPKAIIKTLKNHYNTNIHHIQELKSAQHSVYLISVTSQDQLLKEALKSGNNTLIIRIWKGGARWWNLNSTQFQDGSNIDLAQAEVSGYRIAHCVFQRNIVIPVIPYVLYFSHDYRYDALNSDKYCWALFSYVGEESNYFSNYNSAFAANMVKIRHEFGFLEPHPRHGRVHQDRSLEYAMNVLNSVIIPIHTFFIESNLDEIHDDLKVLCNENPWCYGTMLEMYDATLSQLQNIQHDIPKQNIQKWDMIINICIKCLQHLKLEEISSLPNVLCHLDLQPQNLLFDGKDPIPNIKCVLDWEEAAYADPRFELLLLCRKVCCNNAQANAIWEYYQEITHMHLGRMEPWLNLETLHSVITLTLQGLNVGRRGGTQWEKQRDLLGKIERELKRLVWRGWEFCEVDFGDVL